MGNKARLDAIDGAIRFSLHLEDPLIAIGVTSKKAVVFTLSSLLSGSVEGS
jgi:hypothetical protein